MFVFAAAEVSLIQIILIGRRGPTHLADANQIFSWDVPGCDNAHIDVNAHALNFIKNSVPPMSELILLGYD
jgi:hypothetical protein